MSKKANPTGDSKAKSTSLRLTFGAVAVLTVATVGFLTGVVVAAGIDTDIHPGDNTGDYGDQTAPRRSPRVA